MYSFHKSKIKILYAHNKLNLSLCSKFFLRDFRLPLFNRKLWLSTSLVPLVLMVNNIFTAENNLLNVLSLCFMIVVSFHVWPRTKQNRNVLAYQILLLLLCLELLNVKLMYIWIIFKRQSKS